MSGTFLKELERNLERLTDADYLVDGGTPDREDSFVMDGQEHKVPKDIRCRVRGLSGLSIRREDGSTRFVQWTGCLLLVAGILCGCSKNRHDVVRIPVESGMKELPCVAVFVDDYFAANSDVPNVIVAVWANGTVIHSKDMLEGGAPYHTAHVAADRLEQFFQALEEDRLCRANYYKAFFGFDTAYTGVFVARSGSKTVLLSEHELYERSPRCIATQDGVVALEGRSREQATKSWSREYRSFRTKWDSVRREVDKLVRDATHSGSEACVAFEYKDMAIRW
ncbi:MAG: hypothetical protein IH624_16420 [Phycisphaerae bacterium]|nr:hypothetical protein [Phycisphaerae bacterium]